MDLAMSTIKPILSPPFLLRSTFQNTHSLQNELQSNEKLQNQPNSSHMIFPEHPTLEQTRQIHARMIKTHFDHPHFSPSALYNVLVTSYSRNDRPRYALDIYACLRKMDFEVDNFMVPSVLKACSCSHVSMAQLGEEIHGFALKRGLSNDVFVSNALIQMYGERGNLVSAHAIFDKMMERDVVSWSTMIRCYSRRKLVGEAMGIVKEMLSLGVRPSEVAMIAMVGLFAEVKCIQMGKALHAYAIRNGGRGKMGVHMTTALVDMYAKCGDLSSARLLFNGLNQKNVISRTAMISGYIRCNELVEAAELFVRMLKENIKPNEVTLLSLVVECGFAVALELGKQLHAYILRNEIYMSLALATALVDMYGKCGEVTYAKALFDRVKNKDVLIWSAMIAAYAQPRCFDEALDLYVKMRDSGVRPNQVTMAIILSLCAEAGALDMGKWIHTYIDKQGIEVDMILKTALLDMYAKCGDIDGAYKLFREATDKDLGMWNAMMAGFGMHGCGKEALELFSTMERVGARPNDITFIGLLHACSHAGLVRQGKMLYEKMIHQFGLVPRIEHYGCMVDLLGRAGLLDEAYETITNMPIRPNSIIWSALVAACKLHKNAILGEMAARQLVDMEPQNCGYNISMSNIYAVANRWIDVAVVRKKMEEKGMKKKPGLSSIELNGSVHEFIMGDSTHPQIGEISKMIAEIGERLKENGYKPDTSGVLKNIDEEEKETALNHHSEKLAMAYGLISTAPGTPIRIVKNLRVCDDCHKATKLLSKIYGREIIVRDRKRFHYFREGNCSCGDYW